MDDMLSEDWLTKVKDWELFWTRHMVWQEYVTMSSYIMSNKKRQKDLRGWQQHQEWWGIDDVKPVKAVSMQTAPCFMGCYILCAAQ